MIELDFRINEFDLILNELDTASVEYKEFTKYHQHDLRNETIRTRLMLISNGQVLWRKYLSVCNDEPEPAVRRRTPVAFKL